MTFTVEIVLREQNTAITRHLTQPGQPRDWAESDVASVLRDILLAIDRAKNPGSEPRPVALRGFSWIIEPTDGGVVIAVEIPSGAAVAGPFDIEQPVLDRLVSRVIEASSPVKPVVH